MHPSIAYRRSSVAFPNFRGMNISTPGIHTHAIDVHKLLQISAAHIIRVKTLVQTHPKILVRIPMALTKKIVVKEAIWVGKAGFTNQLIRRFEVISCNTPWMVVGADTAGRAVERQIHDTYMTLSANDHALYDTLATKSCSTLRDPENVIIARWNTNSISDDEGASVLKPYYVRLNHS